MTDGEKRALWPGVHEWGRIGFNINLKREVMDRLWKTPDGAERSPKEFRAELDRTCAEIAATTSVESRDAIRREVEAEKVRWRDA